MATASVEQDRPLEIVPTRFWKHAAIVLAILLAVAVVLYQMGQNYGKRLALSGHSTETRPLEYAIGNDVVSVPENMVRIAEQRQAGPINQLSLYVYWPDKTGYAPEHADAFNNDDPNNAEIVFISLRQRKSILDMRERFLPVYTKALENDARALVKGLNVATLKSELGYISEQLVYSNVRADGTPQFVARCHKSSSTALLAACETDMFVGQSLEMRVRFPVALLRDWKNFNVELFRFFDSLSVAQSQ